MKNTTKIGIGKKKCPPTSSNLENKTDSDFTAKID